MEENNIIEGTCRLNSTERQKTVLRERQRANEIDWKLQAGEMFVIDIRLLTRVPDEQISDRLEELVVKR